MPGIEHEAVVEILHRDPQIVALLLGRAGVELPSGSHAVMADSNLSARDPSTLISDNVMVFEGLDHKVAVIAEVQKARPDRTRRLSWPAYVCNARVMHGCDVILLVFALTREAALGSGRTIQTGHPGFDLTPLVSGHGRLPSWGGGPVYGPQLTMLSIISGDLDLTVHEARMFALRSIADAPGELRAGYTRLIRALVPDSARASLEELMKTVLKDEFVDGLLDQGRSEGRIEGRSEGRSEGRIEEAARIVLRILAARGLAVSADVREQVLRCADTSQLEAWADRAATASSIEEIFGTE
jgi:hypothetical protein